MTNRLAQMRRKTSAECVEEMVQRAEQLKGVSISFRDQVWSYAYTKSISNKKNTGFLIV